MKLIHFIVVIVSYSLPAYCQQKPMVVINEFMADPSPVIGLPNYEWVELFNTTDTAINLLGWRIADGAGSSNPFGAYSLPPGGYVIICGNSAINALSAFGSAIGVTNFPSLNNSGDLIQIRNADGNIIHELNYTLDWYKDDIKKEGGYSIELIDPTKICLGAGAYIASTDISGGTPGKVNATINQPLHIQPPVLVTYTLINPSTINLYFNSPPYSNSLIPANFVFTPEIKIATITYNITNPNNVIVTFANNISPSVLYTLTLTNINNCLEQVSPDTSITFALTEIAAPKDILLNEILVNPYPGANDYIEVYNNSTKILDASHLKIATRNSSSNITSVRNIANTTTYLLPENYYVVTEDADNLLLHYFVTEKAHIIPLKLPVYGNVQGTVVILNEKDTVIDELNYNEKWHHPLLVNAKGVALERTSHTVATQNPENWHSAAASVGYGTPTAKNSQLIAENISGININAAPSVFSPNGDGQNDQVRLNYQMPENGYVGNITIFNTGGAAVKTICKNCLMASPEGHWVWDGRNDRQQLLPPGNYIVLLDVFNTKGQKKQLKTLVTLVK